MAIGLGSAFAGQEPNPYRDESWSSADWYWSLRG
ncbi:hypothetical protein J2S97_001495 [Arthrobacter oryzae]|nr:hypothetical protein [Arthrobacter oryzae]